MSQGRWNNGPKPYKGDGVAHYRNRNQYDGAEAPESDKPPLNVEAAKVFEYWWLLCQADAWDRENTSQPEHVRPLMLITEQLRAGRPASMLMAAIWGARSADWPEDERQRLSLAWIMRSDNLDRYAGAWEAQPYLGTLEWAKVERLTIRCKNAREKGAQGIDDLWPRLSQIRAGLMQGRQLLPNVLRDIAQQIMHAKAAAEAVPCPPVIMRWLEQKLANIGNGPSPSSGMTQDEMEQMLIRMRDLEEENERAEARA